MARVKTFTNGGSLLPGDLNSIEDDYEYAFSTYKDLVFAGASVAATSVTAATTIYLLPSTTVIGGAGSIAVSGALLYLDPADFTGNTRANKYRLRAQLATNTVAPAMTFTFGLYPVSFTAGASATANTYTAGTVTPGSTVAFASQGASTQGQGNSGDFTAPAVGYYMVCVAASAAMAANSNVDLRATLQLRQV